jgi:tetratricopeptide (TPR) repeat protein
MINPNARGQQILRFALALLALLFCYRLIVNSARTGFSRLMSTVSIVESGVEPADIAVRVSPGDPEAHYTRALALSNLGRLQEAVAEFQQTVRLRPHHYYEWLDLGLTLDRLHDQNGALPALNQSVRLAPSFAQPRWQLGSFLYRQEKYEEAFVQLRLGAKSNPLLFDALLNLAWVATGGDVPAIDQLVKPQTTTNHLSLADYLANHGKGADAARHVKEAGEPADEIGRSLLRQTIGDLIATRQFSDAYTAWAISHNTFLRNGKLGPGQVLNGDFLDPIAQNDPGFNWQLSSPTNVSASIDPSGPVLTRQSIVFKFEGDYPAGTSFLSQIVILQPKTRYSLAFMTKTEELVSGGPPLILVFDPTTSRILGQSNPIPTGTNDWKTSEIDFSTEENSSAITVSLQRLSCTQNPCPVFGRLWLAEFKLTRR